MHEITETPLLTPGVTYEQMAVACDFGLEAAPSLRLTCAGNLRVSCRAADCGGSWYKRRHEAGR
jgi:hypothetical protein